VRLVWTELGLTLYPIERLLFYFVRLFLRCSILKLRFDPANAKSTPRNVPPINDNIRFPQVRLIDTDGTQMGILTHREAMQLADERDLDLVLVSDKADPPVCRIMDYGKYKFEQEKRAREARKRQHNAEVKEVKMRYKIDDHDYNVRVKNAQRFLKAGDKVKATVMFRGREIQHSDLAERLLRRMAKDLDAVAEMQQAPKREGRNMMMLLSPKK
jgi:translation initiation factor IF-3